MYSLDCNSSDDNPTAAEGDHRLRSYFQSALADVHCEAACGVLVLRGSVPSPLLRSLAEQAVSRMRGVQRIVNLLTVPS